MIDKKNLRYYREGLVTKESLDNIFCCHIAEVEKPVLRYIELVYEDGKRLFIYDDKAGFAFFEQDFHSRRFTSFHEFFTTEEAAVEDRIFAQFKYYVRRDEDSYICMDLNEALEELKDVPRKDIRLTQLCHYDDTVNYHE